MSHYQRARARRKAGQLVGFVIDEEVAMVLGKPTLLYVSNARTGPGGDRLPDPSKGFCFG
jgi:hypothetical protein